MVIMSPKQVAAVIILVILQLVSHAGGLRDKLNNAERSKAGKCDNLKCSNLFGSYSYLGTSPGSIQNATEYNVARQLLDECGCYPDQFNETSASYYRTQLSNLRDMVAKYEQKSASGATEECDAHDCSMLFGNYSFMASGGGIQNEQEYNAAKEILAKCQCYPALFNEPSASEYRRQLNTIESELEEYQIALEERKRQEEVEIRNAREAAKEQELAEPRRAAEDSIARVETLKEIQNLFNRRASADECFFKCRELERRFGERSKLCETELLHRIRSLTPKQITSDKVADVYFSPQTIFQEWYMEGRQGGYVRLGGRIAWVSGNLAEVTHGSRIAYLVKPSGWIVREGVPIMGYGKPVGDVTYTTAAGGRRTLPCLKIVWLYSPTRDNFRYVPTGAEPEL